jgi:hypothetical protein
MWQGRIENKKYKRRESVRSIKEDKSKGVPLTIDLTVEHE